MEAQAAVIRPWTGLRRADDWIDTALNG